MFISFFEFVTVSLVAEFGLIENLLILDQGYPGEGLPQDPDLDVLASCRKIFPGGLLQLQGRKLT